MSSLFTLPPTPLPPASNARLLYDQHRLEETVAFCQKELPLLEKQIPAKSQKLPKQDTPASPLYQYYALTSILVDTLAQLGRWKTAKEALGRYRMHFPRDPWGYALGAEITRRDVEIQDRRAVAEAADLLEAEAKRLEMKGKNKVR
jgi:hypothetical protein